MMRTRHLVLVAFLAVAPVSAGAEDLSCPKGTTPKGEKTPEVSEAWCETMRDGRAVLHGPYRAWWPNGQLGTQGQYRYDKGVGIWKGWYPDGKPEGEESFEDGRLIRGRYWDQNGKPVSKPPERSNNRLERPGTNARLNVVASSAGRSAAKR